MIENPIDRDFLAQDHHLDRVLTPRECQIAIGVYEGLSNKEIARSLDISPWTVSSHLRQVFAKLGITRRIELCRMWHHSASTVEEHDTLPIG
ncbi:MAG: helix-turn-helix transcriptional regulator [Sphingomonadaceae bacterium]|nr:helix-turn-helix transcriptional regulator [Sphingomonadaceae bacterium]